MKSTVHGEQYSDPLTSLYNRRYLETLLPDIVGKFIEENTPFTLAMVDLDHFKTVNDLHGHARGDSVLQSFAEFLRQSTRSADLLVRYGGDEFLCVMPDIRHLNSRLIFNRILKTCRENEFDGLKMTFSVGLASFPDDGTTYNQLFDIADSSMYDAKRNGRNQIGGMNRKKLTIPIKTFINRRDELNSMLTILRKRSSQLQIAVVNGNVGIGKTRFTKEALSLVKGKEVIWADCLLFSESIAYYTIRELIKYRLSRMGSDLFAELPPVYRLELSKLVPEVLESADDDVSAVDPVVDRYRLYESVRRTFELGDLPKIIVIDNIQWIDSDSLEVLKYLFRALVSTSHIFVMLNRMEETPLNVTELLDHVRREVPVKDISLDPFLLPEVRESVHAILGEVPEDSLVSYAYKSSGGNPYFLEELFRGLAQGKYLQVKDDVWAFRKPSVEIVPKSIEYIALKKYQALSTETQLLLRFATIIGHFDVGLLQKLSDLNESEVQGLLSYANKAGILRESRGILVFVDEFSRRAIYRKFVTDIAGQKMHLKVAEILESEHLGREADIADDLARNYYYGKHRSKGIKYCLMAAEAAYTKYSNVIAIQYFTWAEELLDCSEKNVRQKFDLVLEREKIFDLIGDRDKQKRDLAALADLAKMLSHNEQVVALLKLARFYSNIGDYPNSIETADRAIDLAETADIPAGLATGYMIKGICCRYLSKYDEAYSLFHEALSYASAAGDLLLEAEVYSELGMAYTYHGNYSQARVQYARMIPIYQKISIPRKEAQGLHRIGIVHLELGEFTNSWSNFEKMLRICREIGDKGLQATALVNMGEIQRRQGKYADCLPLYQLALKLSREAGSRSVECASRVNLGLLQHNLGNNQMAIEYCRQAILFAEELGENRWKGYASNNLGHALSALGRYQEAREAYQEAIEIRTALKTVNLTIESLAGLLQVSLQDDSLSEVQAVVDQVTQHLEENDLDGTDEPFRIYSTCYQALKKLNDSRASTVLSKASNVLTELAWNIRGMDSRETCLMEIPCDSDIVSDFLKKRSSQQKNREIPL